MAEKQKAYRARVRWELQEEQSLHASEDDPKLIRKKSLFQNIPYVRANEDASYPHAISTVTVTDRAIWAAKGRENRNQNQNVQNKHR